jgi:tRNA pseudouridine55 synthase
MNRGSLIQGVFPIDKPKGWPSFRLVSKLRRITGQKTVGHAGTLDPFATGVMVLLVGRAYTKLSDTYLTADKTYRAELFLGQSTDTHDCEGVPLSTSDSIPTIEEIEAVIAAFQGEISQIPPMYSAKKVGGKKLYELARKGIEIERPSRIVRVTLSILSYHYPYLHLEVRCSKGTYIRTLAHDIGEALFCHAHLTNLRRIESSGFTIEDCYDGALLETLTKDEFSAMISSKQTSLSKVESMKTGIDENISDN